VLDKTAKSKLVRDIESQLDDFFGDGFGDTSSPTPSLEKLKSAVLSIDWEITDACLSDMITETELLMSHFEEDPVTHALLRMLRGLGDYVRRRKARSHPEAIKRVMSVFANIETLINDTHLEKRQRKNIVAKEIQAFKMLKKQVESQKPPLRGAPSQAPPTQTPADVAALLEHHKFKQAMNAVEERLGAEMKSLKAQVQSLQKELAALRS
jgi:hypothetical protein